MLLIGLSGKKQAGKNTAANGLRDWFQNIHGTQIPRGAPISDVFIPHFEEYSFASPLKEWVCKQVLGLEDAQVYGTDEDKNTLTKYYWETLPTEISLAYSKTTFVDGTNAGCDGSVIDLPRTGKMTAREVMQVVGTDIFRNYFSENVWVDATMRMIKEDSPKMACITDLRFPGEVNAVLDNDGIVIRLLRKVCDDNHPSETSLDDYDFSGDRCFVLDNANMSIEEQNEEVIQFVAQFI